MDPGAGNRRIQVYEVINGKKREGGSTLREDREISTKGKEVAEGQIMQECLTKPQEIILFYI